jgi:uroporphyrin-III C-methyltransferase/precorrin-2 dehydrogenase/sirohydrochlorin ferrochelatase
MDFFPIFLNVRARRAVVIGGGAVATRKVGLLLQAGARVLVVAPLLSTELQTLRESGRIEHRAGRFAEQDLEGAVLVIAATDQMQINAAVSEVACARGIPVNVVDDLERSSFIMPAIVDRSPVIVAVGTSGSAPVLARYVREKIEALLPPQLGRLAALAGRWRRRVAKTLQTVLERRRFWERVFAGPVATHALAGREEQAEFELRRELKRAGAAGGGVGEVYLVGAGPGDPDLLTLQAARLLQQADVVLYDRLVSEEVLARARRDAERIFVGKEAGDVRLEQTDIKQSGVTQARIHELLVELALQGKRVCRLKGGDPFVFGRGGEELEVLAQHHIPFTVVPGITAALGAAAYAGIPLTHRDHAQSVSFVTGHVRDGAANSLNDALNWNDLARAGQTTVFYMGLAQLRKIIAKLSACGAPLSRPAAVVERATLPDQRVIAGTLATLAQQVEAAGVHSPALLIVGEVVALRATLLSGQEATPRSSPPAPRKKAQESLGLRRA